MVLPSTLVKTNAEPCRITVIANCKVILIHNREEMWDTRKYKA